jgi:hypothetical protein
VNRKRAEFVPVDRGFESFVDGRETAVVAHLIDAARADGPSAQLGGGLQIQREGLFAENVLASFQNLHGNFFMSRIGSADENGVTFFEKFLKRAGVTTTNLGGHSFSASSFNVKNTLERYARILGQDRGVYASDSSRSNDSDFMRHSDVSFVDAEQPP